MLPLRERVRFDPGLRGYRCAFCGSEMALLKNRMALLKNRMGLTWGCSGYPPCRNLVPTTVVLQVGREGAEEQKGKGLLAALLGAKLMEKTARGGAKLPVSSGAGSGPDC